MYSWRALVCNRYSGGSNLPIDGTTLVRSLAQLRPNILAYIVSIIGDRHLGEDVLQDVFASAYEKRHTIDNEVHLARWLRVAARHLALNAIRARRTGPQFDSDILDLIDSHWEQYDYCETNDAIHALHECIGTLSPYAQQLVKLRYTQGLSGKPLADHLGKKLNTVYVALTRIHRALAECVVRRMSGQTGDAHD